MTGAPGLRRFVRPGQGAPTAHDPAPGPAAAAGDPAASAPDAGSGPVPLMTRLRQANADGLPGPGASPAAIPAASPASSAAPAPGLGGRTAGQDAERCELCATEVPAEHSHVADLESSTLVCACRACYLLFTQESAGRGRYRAVPDRYLSDPGRTLSAAQWDQLDVPVGLAFFLKSSSADHEGHEGHGSHGGGVTGFYPSPAGVTECILDLAAWEKLIQEYPLLGAAAPDVEAALICRTDAGVEYFLVPIDACYELAGRMRLYWRGFDGGAEAQASIADFLAKVRSRARAFRPGAEPHRADSGGNRAGGVS